MATATGWMATARVATTIYENGQKASYSSGDPCGRHADTGECEHNNPDSGASLVAPPVFQHGNSGDCPVIGNREKACIEYETAADGRGIQKLSRHREQGAFAQYADAA